MKIELSFLERGYFANVLRARAERVVLLVDQRSASSNVQELRGEIAYLKEKARQLDDAEEQVAMDSEATIRLDENSRKDIDYIDQAGRLPAAAPKEPGNV